VKPDRYGCEVTWRGGLLGEAVTDNGVQVEYSTPPEYGGETKMLTPEETFLASIDMCLHMAFQTAAKALGADVVSYRCRAEGFVEPTEDGRRYFSRIVLRPRIAVAGESIQKAARALKLAEKMCLVSNSLRSEMSLEPHIAAVGLEAR